MPPLSVMIKPASGNCNMKCRYCFYCDEQEKRSQKSFGMMSDATLKNVIRKTILHGEGACFFTFQGGEPSLAGLDFFKKAVEYAGHYNRKGLKVHFAFQTNGTMLTEEWCEFFRENDFLVGVSVDGTPEIHDKYRRLHTGEGTCQRVLQGCRLLERCGVQYNILTVVHREVAENIRQIYQWYKKQGWMYQQYITCLDPLFEEKGRQPYSLTPDAYAAFLTELFECWYEDYRKGEHPYNRQFENYISILRGVRPESCEQQGTCGIQYAVEADGSVYPCDFYMLDEYFLGNINQTAIGRMDERRLELGFVRESQKLSGECRQCLWLRLCRSGCQRSRVLQEDGAYRNYFCAAYKTFFERCFPRLKELAEEI